MKLMLLFVLKCMLLLGGILMLAISIPDIIIFHQIGFRDAALMLFAGVSACYVALNWIPEKLL